MEGKSLKEERRQFTVSMLPIESIDHTQNIEKDPKLIFNLHRRVPMLPLIKRNVTIEELMAWDPAPLIESLSFSAKIFKDLVKTIDKILSEIVKKDSLSIPYESINELLHIGLFEQSGIMRDEIYLQLMRRINGATTRKDINCLWKLMICVTAAFPPSKGIFKYINCWLDKNNLSEAFIKKAIKVCDCNLYVFRISGPRGYSTLIEDVKFWSDESHAKVPLFGVELDEIYSDPNLLEEVDDAKIPKIVVNLIDMIKKLNGYQKKGVFRVSGDLQQVFRLKNLLSKDCDSVDIESIKDASVPCSLLKLWMRVLRSPLIPDNLYSLFLVARNNPKKIATLLEENLPRSNFAVISYICNFLIDISRPEHQEFTKMSLDNFSMIFAPCFMRCPLTASALEVLRRAGEERQVLKEIFNIFISIKNE
jgi:Rho GTPase-activating protein 39